MDYAKEMGFEYPDTAEKRRAGMATFRAKLLKAHERFAVDPKLSAKERTFQAELVAHIKAVQVKRGEVQS